LELQTAAEILGEVFQARPGEVEEMIQNRLEERNGEGRAGLMRRGCGRKASAWAISLFKGELESVRMSAKDVSARWLKASRALKR
jgi:hypothetical protein